MKLRDWHERQVARDPEYAKAVAEIDYAQRLADAVVASRLRSGLTQDELAECAGTTQTRISELERGVGNPTLETIERVLAALRIAGAANAASANLLAVQAQAFGFFPQLNATIAVGTSHAFWPTEANVPVQNVQSEQEEDSELTLAA